MLMRSLKTPCSAATPRCVLLLAMLLAHSVAPAENAPTPPETCSVISSLQNDPMLPDGHVVVAYWDFDTETIGGGNAGPSIVRVTGNKRTFESPDGPSTTAASDPSRIVFLLDGLTATDSYVLGYRWWDTDQGSRMQSIQFGVGNPAEWRTALPAGPATAYLGDKPTWARGVLPVPSAFITEGKMQVAIVLESGTDAVIRQLWLMKRPDGPESKRVLILTGDDYAGHHWRSTAGALATVLREDPRLEVSLSESPVFLGSPLLSHYDAVVLHFKNHQERLPLGEPVWTGLQRYLAGGGGLVLSHFACGAFQEWEGFEALAGRVWNPALRGHDPHGTFTVRITPVAHPITEGMSDFEVLDELYTCLDGVTPITVLCEAVSVVDGKTYPIAFTVDTSPGRVFHCVLGHDTRAYAAPGAAFLYRRGVAWAAGLAP